MRRPAHQEMALAFAAVAFGGVALRYASCGEGEPLAASLLAPLLAAFCGHALGRVRSLHHAVLVSVMVGWWGSFSELHRMKETLGSLASLAMLLIGAPLLVLALTVVGRRVDRARPGTLVDGAHRRALASLAAFVVVLDASMTSYAAPKHTPLCVGVFWVAAATIAWALLADARALRRCVRLRPSGDAPIDYGLGDEVDEHHEERPASYRTNAAGVAWVRGSRRRALATIGAALALDAVLLAIAVAAWHVPARPPAPPRGVVLWASDPPRCRR